MEDSGREEPFLKIEKTWSESQGNFESITVKEENISDVEPETLQDEGNENYEHANESLVEKDNIKVDKGCDDVGLRVSNSANNSDGDNNDNHGKDSIPDGNNKEGVEDDEKKEKLGNGKCGKKCTHDTKFLKVVKKKLRCTICKSILCPECYCTVNAPLQNHFSKSDNDNRSVYHCKLCSMIFKSNCALQAHIRVHLLDTPYVCPDCGAMYNNIYFLSLHLINKCHHVYKVIKNWCKFCLTENMAPEEYSAHIEKIHIKPVYKCSQCGLLCENTADINKHLGSAHKNEKVMALNYVCCLICGNLIISKNLYAKHIKYHLINSATFQNGYLCSCGQSFDTATNFRAHFKGCRKKGILPPQWTYLQVSLKTQEMLQVQSASHKSNYLVSSQMPLMSGSDDHSKELGLDKRKMDYNLFEDEDSSEEPDEASESTSRRNSTDSESSKSKKNKGNRKKEPVKVDSLGKANKPVTSNSNKEDRNKVLEEVVQVNSSGIMDEAHNKLIESVEKNNFKPVSEDRSHHATRERCFEGEERICDKSIFIPNVQIIEELSRECRGESMCLNETEQVTEIVEKTDRTGDKGVKIVYDHIPCDHLGYLKTQQSSDLLLDKNLKRNVPNCIRNCELMDGNIAVLDSDNYLITSVLDEKTGIMRTKRVFVQKTPIELVEDQGNVAKDSDEIYVLSDNLDNSDSSAALPWRDPQKTKNTTVFSCPFCSVLFPRHFSSFQRFRLHLECYHPDASIDITVDRTEVPKSKTNFTSITINDNSDSDDVAYDLDDIDFQTRLNNNLMEVNGSEERQNDQRKKGVDEQVDGRDPERDSHNNKSDKDEAKSTNDVKSGTFSRRFSDESRTECFPGEETELSKRRRTDRANDVVENSESAISETSNLFSKKINSEIVVTVETDRAGRGAIISDATSREPNQATHPKSRSCSEESSADGGKAEGRRDNEVNCYDENAQMSMTSREDAVTGRSCFTALSEKELRSKNVSTKDTGGCQEIDLNKTESNNSVKEVTPDRSCERLNPRRESDVWSEFYKTLKIAENFKRTNLNNKDRSRDGNEETSILKNYTNKRVVKKPKRYRESSDSEESNDDSKPFDSRVDADDDDLYIKKKKLLNRLENADYKVLEYVFKVLERKQKNMSLLKKSATDGRAGRRRLSNGVKLSGKQQQHHKTVVSENDEDTMDCSMSAGDKDSLDDNIDEADWDAPTGTSFEEKVADRRRGRPKKSDVVSMRERRRSDFDRELSLIEKSLDADDADFFTSKRRRRFSSKPQYGKKQSTPIEKNDFSSGQVITTKSCEAGRKLMCAVCKEGYQSEPEFREHIQTHRMDESSHQCMECGECFVVRPSLEKHLHAFHKIKDVQKYIEENECSIVEKVDEPEPLKENQCKVCMDQFESAHDLNKHFRMHGMAFLREVKKDNKPA